MSQRKAIDIYQKYKRRENRLLLVIVTRTSYVFAGDFPHESV